VAPEARVISFRVVGTSGHARAGVMSTSHGDVPTPAFMPVGTQATVKGLDADDLEAIGTRLMIMNTYHLWLRPTAEVVAELGGLHAFSRFRGAIVTDSGGFQAYSLSERTRLSEDGFEFASHLDGKKLLLSPEEAMRIQGLLGSDIAMQLDVCPSGKASPAQMEAAVARTSRWAERCLQARKPGQAVFGIVQGGSSVDLRLSHAETLAKLPFEGLALGGFSVGEPNHVMHETVGRVAPRLDPARPRYLMGVGTPSDLVRAIGAGIDIFDCVMPTRNARNGQAFVRGGKIVIKNARYKADSALLEPDCPCPACRGGYSRAYLRHLYVAHEMLASRLLTLHNLTFYAQLVAEARKVVLAGDYAAWAEGRLRELEANAPADDVA
jgi:queuine tRNA-ribosyltransferase